jgi:hypothetical protein
VTTTGFTKNFVVKNGLTTGAITLDGLTGNISGTNASLTGNLSVTGKSNLGNIGNVNITGGSSGYLISTDGAGNLNFINPAATQSPAPMPTYVASGDTVTVSANYQGIFGYPITIDGTLTVDGILIDVNDNTGGNSTPGGLNTQLQYNNAGSLGGISTATYESGVLLLGSNANIKISGGSIGQYLQTDGTGNLSWGEGGTGGTPGGSTTQVQFNDAGSFAGNTGFTFNKTTGVLTALIFSGFGNALANLQGSNVVGEVPLATYATTANAVAGANVSGAVSFATTANAVAGANVSGAVAYATTANSVAGANVSGAVALANYASIANSVAGANVSGEVSYASVANSVSAANVSGAVALANYASVANSVAGANVSGAVGLANYASVANSVAGANVSGEVPYASVANSIAGANISGQVSNAAIAGTVYTNAQPNITSVGTLTSLTVNGNISANNANITGNIVPTSNNVYSLGSATSYWKDAYIGPGSLYINGVKVLEESSNAIVISADLNQTVKVTSSGSGDIQLQTTGSGIIAVKGPLQIQAGNLITSSNGGPIGFSNPINVDTLSSLSANTNLTISANGTGNIQINDDVTISGNLTVNGGGGNLSVSSLSVEDNIIDISAETTGTPINNSGIRVIRGDDPAVQMRWNETSDTWQTTNDGSTYLNIVGSSTSTGNANVGNIGATGGIFTTVAGSLTTAAQPNITSTGILSSISVSGNANVGNIGTAALVATGTGSFGANVNMNSNWITHLGYPTANTDAASKQYVDTMVSTGISYHQPVNVATTTTLATATGGTTAYNSPNGAANGIGAYISTTGTFTNIDGANVQTVGTRILVKDEANATWNGVYTYANTTAIVRSSDTDTYGVDLSGTDHLGINDYFFTLGGVVNEGTSFIVSAPTGTITFGTSNIEFSTFSTSQVYDAGTGLSLTGTTFSVNASQTQVTAVGTLSSLTVSGNANVGNIGATNGVFTNVSGNGSALTSITGANVTGQVTFAGTANAVAGGNVSGQVGYAAVANSVAGANVSGEVSFAATANAVAGANVSGAVSFATTANAVAGANVSGAVNLASYATTANAVAGANVSGVVSSATIAETVTTAAQPNITSVGTLSSLSVAGDVVGGNLMPAVDNTGVVGNAALTWSNGQFSNLTVDSTLNVRSAIDLADSDILRFGSSDDTQLFYDGTNNTMEMELEAAAASFIITDNGTTRFTFTKASGDLAATSFTGSGSGLTSIPGANVTGTVASATTADTVTTAAQPNVTSVGTLSSLSVSGNANIGNLGTDGLITATGNITGGNIVTGGLITATGNITGGNLKTTGVTITTNTVSATGNINGGNIITAGQVSATGNIIGGNLTTTGGLASIRSGTPGQYIDIRDIDATGAYIAGYSTTTNAKNIYIDSTTDSSNTAPSAGSLGIIFRVLGVNEYTMSNVGMTFSANNTLTMSGVNSAITGVNSITATANISGGNLTTAGQVSATGNITAGNVNVTGQLISTVSTGTAPLVVSSTTKVANLNADLLDGYDLSSAATNSTVVLRSADASIFANLLYGTLATAAQPNITSTGTLTSLGIGTAPQSGVKLDVTGSVAGFYAARIFNTSGTGYGIKLKNGSDTNDVLRISNAADSADTILMYGNGNATFAGNVTAGNLTTAGTMTAGTVTETSSLALKENFRPIENPLEKVLQLFGKIYDRKDGSSKDEAGLVAEDVYKIIPNLVKTDANGNPESVFYTRLTVYLLESIKVLNDEIADLKGKKRKSKK